ncbi:hypothetical protein [Kitasatospora nipponensis]|uniref:hypothetical protein n=1 Tax=Kitasatospora nipponensis TaxID=258049 RepID=UPI0031DC3583
MAPDDQPRVVRCGDRWPLAFQQAASGVSVGISHYWRRELEPVPRLYLGHLERGAYVDRLVQVGETTALTTCSPSTSTPPRWAAPVTGRECGAALGAGDGGEVPGPVVGALFGVAVDGWQGGAGPASVLVGSRIQLSWVPRETQPAGDQV